LAQKCQNQTRRRAAVEDQVEHAPEGRDAQDGQDERPPERDFLHLVEPDEERRARDDRDRGGGAAQGAPLIAQRARLIA